MNANEKIQNLESEVTELKYQIMVLKSYLDMQSIPEWAKEAFEHATIQGLVSSPIGGSLDFYRLLAYLHKKEE